MSIYCVMLLCIGLLYAVFCIWYNLSFWEYYNFDQVARVFANGLGDLGSIPRCVIPKTLKWYLIPPSSTVSDKRYVSRVKWSNPGKGVAPSSTLWYSSYWKRSLLVALDHGRQLYSLYLQLMNRLVSCRGVAARTCSGLHAAFLCNCHLVSVRPPAPYHENYSS